MGRTKRCRKKRGQKAERGDIEKVLSLKKWLGIRNLNLKVVFFHESGRGVVSRKEIKCGTELIAVPLDKMVTVDFVKKSTISRIFPKDITSQVALSMWLVYERHLGAKSEFYEYLNVLPATFDSLMCCSQLELDVLPVWLRKPVDERLRDVNQAFDTNVTYIPNEICEECGQNFKDIFSKDAFIWAWVCVNTRCVYYEEKNGDESSSSIALAPFLDLFNHSNAANVEVKLDCQRGVYSVRTNTSYRKHEQIFIKYGAFPNLRLLVEYGFIMDDEDQDVIEFGLEEVLKAVRIVDRSLGDISKLKYKFISMNSLNVNLNISRDGLSWNLKGLLYILVTKDSDLPEILQKTYSSRWSQEEEVIIQQIQNNLVFNKIGELQKQLGAMETLSDCSFGFTLAKRLVEQYIRILKYNEVEN